MKLGCLPASHLARARREGEMKRALPLLAVLAIGLAQAQWVNISRPDTDWIRMTYGCVWDPVGDKIYMYGGTPNGTAGSDVPYLDRYDPIRDTWERMASMAVRRGWFKGAYCRGKLYAMGGNDGLTTDACESYDISADTWTAIPSMPGARCAYGIAVWRDSLIFVIGGYSSQDTNGASVFVYNPFARRWSTGTSMPSDCESGDACILGDTIWFAGGIDMNTLRPDSAMRIGVINPDDPTQIAWSWGPALPCGPLYMQTTVAIDGKVAFFGGWTQDKDERIRRGWLYDPILQTFDTLPWLPSSGTDMPSLCGAVRATAHEIYRLSTVDISEGWPPPVSYCKIQLGPAEVVEEMSRGEQQLASRLPTVVRNILEIPQTPSARREASSVLLDASGRKVLALNAGANDVSRVAPGIYFVRLRARNFETSRKIVIAE